jgi:hypothetical protein
MEWSMLGRVKSVRVSDSKGFVKVWSVQGMDVAMVGMGWEGAFQ